MTGGDIWVSAMGIAKTGTAFILEIGQHSVVTLVWIDKSSAFFFFFLAYFRYNISQNSKLHANDKAQSNIFISIPSVVKQATNVPSSPTT